MSGRAMEIRAALLRHRKETARGRYPEALHQQAVDEVRLLRAKGTSFSEVARELGVRVVTVRRWAAESRGPAVPRATPRDNRPDLSLVPIVLRGGQPIAEPGLRLEVEFPGGTRLKVSGMLEGVVVQAIEALRRSP